jgi:type I restriction enzyme S subunit
MTLLDPKLKVNQHQWQVRGLGELAEVLDHLRIPVNTEERDKRIGNVPYYGANGIQGYIDKQLFDEPLVLLAEDGGNFDDFASRPIAYRIDGPSWINNHAHILRSSDANTILDFLFHALEHRDIRRYISGGTRGKLTQAELRSIEILTPPTTEQARIAEVLDTLDEAIRGTEKVVSKMTTMKAALARQLLTCGVDSNGEHRDPISNPTQFRKAAYGLIPSSWLVRPAGEVCDEIVVGIVVRPTQYYREGGVPVLRSANVRANGLDSSGLVFMSEEDNKRLLKSQVRAGNVLTVRTGYPGTSCVVPPALAGANCVDIIISRVGTEVLPEFFSLWLNSDFGKDQVLKGQIGLAQQHFNVGDLKQLLVYIPPIEEQRRIVAVMADFDSLIQQESQGISTLRALKSGLSSDLLTGRVRVPTRALV